ncbi:nitric oxide synthase oxygenase [Nonomuraea ferruginea]
MFPPDLPARRAPRVLNDQLIRYAGYREPGGSVVGDPRHVGLTELATSLGWRGGGGRFDVLPLVIQPGMGEPLLCNVPGDVVLEVPIEHPEFPWFAELGLRWHAVPAISGMCLEIGGVCYPCAPFNGWYMGGGDRRPQPGRRRPLRPAARGGRAARAGRLVRAVALA